MKIFFFRGGFSYLVFALLVEFCVALAYAAAGADATAKSPRTAGDEMIESYLQSETEKIETNFLTSIKDLNSWEQSRPRFHQEYFDMLGLWPLPERTALRATITRTMDRGDYKVDMIHYQSRPGLYVTGNLYRPASISAGEKLPAVLYVCGHAQRGRNGNKTAYQSHGIWFARHGYICLMLDTLQLGEIAGIHHGTYREGRWWWLSHGYTPAGVECWNGIRAVDYLVSRPDVDSQRIGVTGISGGGAATFWIAAADERVKVAVPVSGLTDLSSYVSDHVVDGHCDCMFLYNTYQWPWARIPALIAPRPLLYVNSDHDSLFPIEGDERVINRLERVYSLFGAGDMVDSLVSIGGHAYRKDIRQAAYRFVNTFLKQDSHVVSDSEVDLVVGDSNPVHPIAPEQLRVFPNDSDFPADARNAQIDQEFVATAKPGLLQAGEFETWKSGRLARLRNLTFHHFPDRIPPARALKTISPEVTRLETEPGIWVILKTVRASGPGTRRVWLVSAGENDPEPTWWKQFAEASDGVYLCQPRGIGSTSWTRNNPPNYVERAHFLLGRTVDSGRVWDLAATARYLTHLQPKPGLLRVAGQGAAGVLAVYAALLEPEISEVWLQQPPSSHMQGGAPALLNVLRVCDIPEAVGMLSPRPVRLVGANAAFVEAVSNIYRIGGAPGKFSAD